MNSKKLLLFFSVCSTLAVADEVVHHPICVVTPSYNNIEWYKKNIDSICEQD